MVGLVARGGQIRDPLRRDRVDRLGDETGLEEGVVGEAKVVVDDLGARGVGQGQDVLGKCLAVRVAGREREPGTWRPPGPSRATDEFAGAVPSNP